jgi:putative MATE family efflux protein
MKTVPQQPRVRTDYTEGSIVGAILKMGVPSMFGFISENIYNLVDTWWVSRLPGAEAGVAALTFFATIRWLFFSFNQFVGPGSVAIISRRYGEKEYDLAETAIKETLILKFAFGGFSGIVGFFTVEYMLRLLGAEGQALTDGIEYGRIIFLGLAVMYATYSIYTAMRSMANPRMAMYLMIAANLLNIGLDPLLMFGYLGLPAMGIKGAAIASVLSYVIVFLVGIGLLNANITNVPLRWKSKYRVSWDNMVRIMRIGLPAWTGSLSFSSARLVITPLIAQFGTEIVAAYGVCNRITHFGIMLLVGIGLGVSSLIGHTLGSGKVERAKKTADTSILMAIGAMTLLGAVAYFLPAQIMGLFFESPETIGYGVTILRIIAFAFPFLGAFLMIEEIHMGVGLNTPTMFMNILHAWIFQAGPIFLVTTVFGYGHQAIWWIITISVMVSAIIFFWYYQRGRWLTVKV